MKLFSSSSEFRALNIGVALDEGLARNDDRMTVFYGEQGQKFVAVLKAKNRGAATSKNAKNRGVVAAKIVKIAAVSRQKS